MINQHFFVCGKVILKDKILNDAAVEIKDSKIVNILNKDALLPNSNVIYTDGYVCPGFVDIHVHGGGGFDFMDADFNEFCAIAKTHAKHGTTSLTPTTLSAPKEDYLAFFKAYKKALEKGTGGADFIGIHFEGPYISKKQAGAQPPEYIKNPDIDEIYEYIELSGNNIVRWDVAPELENSEVFSKIKMGGALISIGHSIATAPCAINALKNGYTHITHMYSATTTEHKVGQTVYGGIVEAAYLEDDFTIELIGDGHHIPKETMLLAFKIKGADKIALITDAMRAAGTNTDKSTLGSRKFGIPVIVEQGVAKLPDRTFYAGSIATMDIVLKTAIRYGVPLLSAVKACTYTPAKIIGANNKGEIAVGKDADIVILSENYDVLKTFVRGEEIK